ncbi:RNA polymerase sigma factor [bacterium]|nr:RNA polymerase sigma factor [bacterium]
MKKDNNKEFGKIYDRYVEKIYRFVYLKVSSKQVAEDITSEVFLKTFRVFQRRKAKKIKNPGAFLFKTAKNILTDFYRKRSKFYLSSLEEIKEVRDPGQEVVQKEIVREETNKILQAMSRLKEDYRDLLLWYYVEDLSVPEISQITDKSENAVRVTIHRAMNALKKILEEEEKV